MASSPPVPDPPRGDLRLVVFGDFNGAYGSEGYAPAVSKVIAAIVDTWRPELVLLPGDVVAGQDRSLPDERFGAMWAAFDRHIAAPFRAAGIPYLLAIGNHDGSSLRGTGGGYAYGRERRAASIYWRARPHWDALAYVDAGATDPPFRYAISLGPLFIAVWDASSAQLGEEELRWARTVFATPPARSARFRFLMGHLPLFGIAEGRARAGEVLPEGATLATLLASWGIDTYVSGHQAAYYPGSAAGLELLFAGGVGARRLLGHAGPPRSAVVVTDLWLDGRIEYSAFDISDFSPIEAADLPLALDAFGGAVRRSDRDLR